MVVQPKYQIIALISGIFIVAGFSHLVKHVHITKETKHLSYNWIMLVLSGQTLLAIYALLNHLYITFLTAVIISLGVLYIFYIKRTYEKNDTVMKELTNKKILL